MRFHIKLLKNNNTTLEFLNSGRTKKPIIDDYNLDTKSNFEQIFGEKKCLWMFPIESRENKYDGINYPKKNVEQQLL